MPMLASGLAQISSTVAAYEDGTWTSNSRPVAVFRVSARISPPATISSAETDGTNNTWIGLSAVPIDDSPPAVSVTVVSVGVVVSGAAVVSAGAVVSAPAVVVASSSPPPQAASTRARAPRRAVQRVRFTASLLDLFDRGVAPPPPVASEYGRRFSVANRQDQLLEVFPAGDVYSSFDRVVPRADVAGDHPARAATDELLQVARGVLEVDVAVDLPFAVEDVHLPGRESMLGDPLESVVDRPMRLGGEDHDVVAAAGEPPESLDRPGVGLQVAEHRAAVVVLGPLPELAHVAEMRERGDGIPRLHRVERDVSHELRVVAADPTRIEVGDDAVEVDP